MGKEQEQKLFMPADLKEAEGLLIIYGRWAKDTGRPQRCRSAEGAYISEEAFADEDGDTRLPMIPSWQAMNIQRALVATPERERKVLQMHYVSMPRQHHAAMRKAGFSPRTWNEARIHGMRMFWNIYRLHHQEK